MSVATVAQPLSPQESARVTALSATIAGGVVFLYLLDLLILGRVNPEYRLMWPIISAYPATTNLSRMLPPALWSLWTGVWMLSGLQAIRSPGSRRLALMCVVVMVAGVALVMAINHLVRRQLMVAP